MNFSEHAEKRKQQRGISPSMVEVLKIYGASEFQASGCETWFLDKRSVKKFRKDMRRIASMLDRKSIPCAIVHSDCVLTVLHRYKKARNHQNNFHR